MNASELKTQGLLDAALEIAAERSNILREVKSLLLADKDAEAIVLMRRYLGIEKSTLSNSRLYGIAGGKR